MSVEQEDLHEVRYDVSWEEFERFLCKKGDDVVPRITYLDGVLELVTPSFGHEKNGSWIARLVEVYAEHQGITLSAFGSWTLKDKLRRAGAEPDECYIFGEDVGDDEDESQRPHLAIEIDWSRSSRRKLEAYRRLGVPEVWLWKRSNVIEVHVMRADAFARVERSACTPDLDLVELCSYLRRPNMSVAKQDYRKALANR